jgi:hypothetical protein
MGHVLKQIALASLVSISGGARRVWRDAITKRSRSSSGCKHNMEHGGSGVHKKSQTVAPNTATASVSEQDSIARAEEDKQLVVGNVVEGSR